MAARAARGALSAAALRRRDHIGRLGLRQRLRRVGTPHPSSDLLWLITLPKRLVQAYNIGAHDSKSGMRVSAT